MAWWKIKNVKTGQIDFGWAKKRRKKGIFSPCNARPVTSKSSIKDSEKLLYNGDQVADLLGDCIDKIRAVYLYDWKREPYREEILAVFNFVLNGLYDDNGKITTDSEISKKWIEKYLDNLSKIGSYQEQIEKKIDLDEIKEAGVLRYDRERDKKEDK